MSVYVIGVGVGLFSLISLWAFAIILFIISVRTQKYIGHIVVIFSLIITVILLSLKRDSGEKEEDIEKVYDHLFIWRILLLIFLGVTATLTSLFIFIQCCIEPVVPKRIQNW